MENNDNLLLIGVSIISELHDNFIKSGPDDLEHITQISIVIRGIANYLKTCGTSDPEIETFLTKLKEYGKKLWIESCVEAAHDDESESDVREETDYIFDYVFDNHKYPY